MKKFSLVQKSNFSNGKVLIKTKGDIKNESFSGLITREMISPYKWGDNIYVVNVTSGKEDEFLSKISKVKDIEWSSRIDSNQDLRAEKVESVLEKLYLIKERCDVDSVEWKRRIDEIIDILSLIK